MNNLIKLWSRKGFYYILFIGLFLATLDFWNWEDEVALGMIGLPAWAGGFILLHLIFVAILWLFSKRIWGKDEEETNANLKQSGNP